MFIRFDRIHQRDTQTDRQTHRQTPHDGIGRACIASLGKNGTKDVTKDVTETATDKAKT